MFQTRSNQLERIDTGEYTAEEYERFLREIAFVNRYVGDRRALKRSLVKEIKGLEGRASVLDVGAGSGELLRSVGSALKGHSELHLVGLDNNYHSARAITGSRSNGFGISSVQGDALSLPFPDSSFDYVISSLFTHHLTSSQIVQVLQEMSRVASKKVFVIDLHRHPVAYGLYNVMCSVLRISELVKHDGSLSILRGFRPDELQQLGSEAGLSKLKVDRSFPFRLVLSSHKTFTTKSR